MSDTDPATENNGKQERLAAWIQLPRRLVLLLIAFALVQLVLNFLPVMLIAPDLRGGDEGPVSLSSGQPVSRLIGERLPTTGLLLALTIAYTFPLIALLTTVALLTHRLEIQAGLAGSVVKGLGRLVVFALGASPSIIVAVGLVWLFAFQLKMGSAILGGAGASLPAFILPALVLALFPAMLTAQTLSHALTRPLAVSRPAAVFNAIAMLLSQLGGMLSALMLVETIFGLPGVGQLFVNSVNRADWPVTLGGLGIFSVLVLTSQIIAELFLWLARLQTGPVLTPPVLEPNRWRITARRVWVGLALALLIIPLGILLAGVFTPEKAALTGSLADRNQPPSLEHPMGTDKIGRDIQARFMRGLFGELSIALGAGLTAWLISLPLGAAAGYLITRKTWWADSLSDVLLLPVRALPLVPSLPLAIIILAASSGATDRSFSLLISVLLLVLLPRSIQLFSTLWAATTQSKVRFVAGPAAALLAILFAGFGLILSLDFVGIGIQLPLPTAAEMFTVDNFRAEASMVLPGIIVLLCSLASYTAADALMGYFDSKDAMSRLNT